MPLAATRSRFQSRSPIPILHLSYLCNYLYAAGSLLLRRIRNAPLKIRGFEFGCIEHRTSEVGFAQIGPIEHRPPQVTAPERAADFDLIELFVIHETLIRQDETVREQASRLPADLVDLAGKKPIV